MGKRIYSLAQHTVPKWHPAEMIYNAASLGYDAVAIRAIAQGVPGESFFDMKDKKNFDAAKKAMDETGVFIHDVDLIAINNQTDIPSYEGDLEAIAQLGVSGFVCSVWTPEKQLYTDKFAQLCDLAEKYGLTANLEFVTWAEIKGVNDARALLEEVNKPAARILVDTLHCRRSQVTIDDIKACPPEWFDIIHVCDIDAYMPTTNEELASTGRTLRLYPGEGAADIRGIVDAIKDDAIIGIEIPHKERLETLGAYEFAKRCLAETKKYFA